MEAIVRKTWGVRPATEGKRPGKSPGKPTRQHAGKVKGKPIGKRRRRGGAVG